MLTVELAEKPYAHEVYNRALPSGGRGVGQIEYYSGRLSGAPGRVPGLAICGGLVGRCLDGARSLLGEGVARSLASRHAAQRLPSPNDWVALLSGNFYADPAAVEWGTSGNVRPVWMAFRAQVARVVGVAGPHDIWIAASPAPFLNGQIEVIDGIKIAGISGIIGADTRGGDRPISEFVALLQELLKFVPHIVLLHESPLAGRESRGRQELLEVFLAAGFSGLVISSRIGSAPPLVVQGQTTFLNVHGRVVSLVCAD
jgi:Icc protein